MYDALQGQVLIASAMIGFFALLGLAFGLWWLRQGLRRRRSGAGSWGPPVVAAALALSSLVGIVALVLFNVLLMPGLVDSLERLQVARVEQQAMIDKPAPDLHFSGVADDRAYDLEEFRGEVLLVNFWATWCHPCREEMPDLERLQGDLGERGFKVIHLSSEPRDTLTGYLEDERPANLHVYAEHSQWPAPALPTTFLVDREGLIRDVLVGGKNYDDFAEVVEPLLQPSPASMAS